MSTIASRSIFLCLMFVVFIALVLLFREVLLPFVLGATIAYLLNPAVNRMISAGMNRTISVLIILGAFTIVIAAFLVLTVPVLLREATGFIESAPGYADQVWDKLTPYLRSVRGLFGYNSTAEMTDQLQDAVKDNIGKTLGVGKNLVGSVATGLAAGSMAVLSFIGSMLLIPIVAFFMMKDWPRIVSWAYALVPRYLESTVRDLMDKIDVKIAGFIRGQFMVCILLGLFYALGLSLAGLNYGFFIGLATGFLCIIPFAGAAIGMLTGVMVAALQSQGDVVFMGVIVAIFAVGQFIEGNFVSPKLIGDSVGLHPLWIIFALLAGGSMLGLLGMFLAVPVAAVISVLVTFAIQQYRASTYYQTQ